MFLNCAVYGSVQNINAQQEMSYDESRDEGTSRMEGELITMHETCPATKFIIVLISIGTMYTIFTAQPDFTHLNEQAQEIPTTLPNWWVSAINSVGLQVIVVVSMAIVIGGNFLDSREVGLGGIIGGFIFLFLLAVLVGSMYISVETVLETDMPTLAMVTKIHPALGTLMAFAIYGMIYNTAIGMFYALAKRLTRDHRQHFYKVYVAIVLVGFVLYPARTTTEENPCLISSTGPSRPSSGSGTGC